MTEHDIQIVGKTGRGRATTVSVDGREMRLADACARFGIRRRVVQLRLYAGWSAHDALTTPVHPYTRALTFGGRTMSIAAWARETGLKATTIIDRLNTGRSVEEALTRPLEPRCTKVTIDGRTMPVVEWCRALGLNYGSVKNRVKSGMSHYDALTRPFRSYGKISKMAEAGGVPYRTAYKRHRKLGWDLSRATTTPPLPHTSPLSGSARPVEVGGELMTRTEASRKVGGAAGLVSARLKRGWDFDEATGRIRLDPTESGQMSVARRRAKELAEMGIVC